MPKKGSRDTRFSFLKTFFSMSEAGLQTDEAIKQNIEFAGFSIYEKELEKFAAEFPDIDVAKFTEFLKKYDVLKTGSKKVSDGSGKTSLNTVEKAKTLGVADENVEKYIALVNQLYAIKKELQPLITLGTISLAIPIREQKEKKDA